MRAGMADPAVGHRGSRTDPPATRRHQRWLGGFAIGVVRVASSAVAAPVAPCGPDPRGRAWTTRNFGTGSRR